MKKTTIIRTGVIAFGFLLVVGLVALFTKSYALTDLPDGVSVFVPDKVVVNEGTWDGYTGDGLIYDWDNFKISIKNNTKYDMTNLELSVSGVSDTTDSNNVTKSLYHENYDQTIQAGNSLAVRYYGVLNSATDYKNPTETIRVKFSLNGNEYVKDYMVKFDHVMKELSSLPLVASDEKEYKITYNKNEDESLKIKINKSKIYMDKSEDLYDQDVRFSYYSTFAMSGGSNYYVQAYSPQSASSAKTVYNEELTPRLSQYFSYTNYDNIFKFTGSEEYQEPLDTNGKNIHRLYGSPNGTLTGGLVDVYVPIYVVYHKSGSFGSSGYDYNTYQDANFSGMKDVKLQVSVTDKEALGKRILAVQTLINKTDKNIYETDELQALVDSAVAIYNKRDVTQEQIDAKTESIQSDSYTFKEKQADYTEVNKIVKEANNIKKTIVVDNKTYNIYKTETLDTLQQAIDSINYDLTITKQSEVDAYVTTIREKINALEKNEADYTNVVLALQNKINEVKKTTNTYSDVKTALEEAKKLTNPDVENTKLYTTESFNALTAELAKMDTTLKMDKQDVVSSYAKTLNDIILVKNSADYKEVIEQLERFIKEVTKEEVSYTDIKSALAKAKALKNPVVRNKEVYTSSTFKALMDEISTINPDIKIDDQTTANKYYQELVKIKLEKNDADYSKVLSYLNKFISEIEEKKVEYTKVTEALDKAKSLKNPTIKYTEKIYNEIGEVTEKDKYINRYTDESFESLRTTLLNITTNKKADEASVVEEQEKALDKVVLVKNKASYVSIDSTIKYLKSTEAYKKNWYKGNGLTIINNFINQIDRNKDITEQSYVEDANKKLINLMTTAEYKNADYSKINALMSKINKLKTSDYSNYSVVKTAISNIVYGKTIDKQDSVDEMYENLLRAYNSLKKKSVSTNNNKNNASNKNNSSSSSKNDKKEESSNKNDSTKEDKSNKDDSKQEETKTDQDESKSLVIEKVKINGDTLYLTEENYTYTVAYNMEEAQIDVVLTNEKDSYTIDGPERLSVGRNTYKINVKAEDGSKYSYELVIMRKGNAQIESLTVKDHNIDFKKDVYEYNVFINSKTTALNLDVDTVDSSAKVQILGNENLKNGSVVTIKVTSNDGTTQEYKLNIEKEKKDFPVLFVIPIIVVIGVVGAYFGLKPKQGTV